MVLVGIAFVIFVVSFLNFIIKKRAKFLNILLFGTVLIAGAVVSWQIKILEEKMHILEYGILGWFAARDLMKANTKIKGSLLACLVCVMAGVLDEGFQKILPYRVFELRDIRMNILGGIWGVILYLLS